MKRSALGLGIGAALLIATSIGCTSVRHWWNPADGFVAVGTPEQSFEDAKAVCLEESKFRTAHTGFDGTNWNEFWRCMEERGWVQH